MDLGLAEQLLVVVTNVLASVEGGRDPGGRARHHDPGVQGGGLPSEHIAVLLAAADWFLDRCRTTINVLGDI